MAMCGVKQDKRKYAWQFMKAAKPFMIKNDSDGLGYAASSPSGLFGERWLDVWSAFKVKGRVDHDKNVVDMFGDALIGGEPMYSDFGDTDSQYNADALIYHSRMATCGLNLDNVHPFVEKDTALIHNGVISNPEDFKLERSTCDSEAILVSYLDKFVNYEPDRIQEMENELEGYYACAVLTTDKDDTRVLDIFKSKSASLVCAYIPEIGATVFCTSEEIIRRTLKALQWAKPTEVFTVKEGYHLRFDCETGELLSLTEYQTDEYGYGNSDGYGYNSPMTGPTRDWYEGYRKDSSVDMDEEGEYIDDEPEDLVDIIEIGSLKKSIA